MSEFACAMRLDAYLAAHPDQFRGENAITFRHVFLSSARGKALERDMKEISATLASTKSTRTGACDPFLLGDSFRSMSQSEAARTFGKTFAEKLFAPKPGGWQGPLSSAYGIHFVFVDEQKQGTLPPLNAVRQAVEREWANARRVQRLEEFYRTRRQRYEITVQVPPAAQSATLETAGAPR